MRTPPSRALLIAAFAAVYVIWGSTYLAIKWARESMPPFLMAGTRFVLAGSCMYACSRWRGAARPRPAQWRDTAIVGALLLLGGNGCVVWALGRIPSGVSSLIVATTPLWIVGFDFARGGARPSVRTLSGLLLGSAGLILLVDPSKLSGPGGLDLLGIAVNLVGTISWAAGSVYARDAQLPASPFLAAGMQQISGGLLIGIAGLVSGEAARFDPSAVSIRSELSYLYLIVIGSFVAFTAYVWLLQVTTAAKVSTYAYVNPAVAVFLGWAFNGETFEVRTLLAAAVIVLGVAVITLDRARSGGRQGEEELSRAEPVEPDQTTDVPATPSRRA